MSLQGVNYLAVGFYREMALCLLMPPPTGLLRFFRYVYYQAEAMTMYEKVFEQTERLFKPVGEIWALQAQAAESLARKQSSMVADLWNQGVMTLQSIPTQKNIEDVWKLQQEYWENLNGCMREMMEDTQGILLDTNQKINEVLQKAAPETGAAIKGAAENIAETATNVAKKAEPIAKKAAATAPAPTKAAAKGTPPVPVKPMAEAIKTATTGKESSGDKKAAAAPIKASAPSGGNKSEGGNKSGPSTKSGAGPDDKAGKLI